MAPSSRATSTASVPVLSALTPASNGAFCSAAPFPAHLKEIAELIGGLSSDMHAGFADVRAEMHAGFASVRADIGDLRSRLDRMDARLDRHGALLQTGSRWVNRMNQWAERRARPQLVHRFRQTYPQVRLGTACVVGQDGILRGDWQKLLSVRFLSDAT